jgi:hypothetical protein
MDWSKAIFKPPLIGPTEAESSGLRPVIFDILGPDRETSILPSDYRLVLWANPEEMSFSYTRKVERIQTRGGWVEQHWGDDVQSMSIQAGTGGFMRLYSGLSNITNPQYGGTRRETLAYDRYLDFLALFHNNGSVYDAQGQVALQGIIKITFDGGVYLGWFSTFTVTEDATHPYMFKLSMDFDIDREEQNWRTLSGAHSSASENNSYAEAVNANELANTSITVTADDFIDQQLRTGGALPRDVAQARADLEAQGATFYRNPDGTIDWIAEGDDG